MLLYFDVETTGLDPFRDEWVTFTFSHGSHTTPKTLFAKDHEQVKRLLKCADVLIAHNIHFDLSFLGYVPRPDQELFCTAYASRLIDFTREKHSLDELARAHCMVDPYAHIDKATMQKSNWKGELTPEQLAYAQADVAVLPEIRAALLTPPQPLFDFDMTSLRHALHIQRRGLPVRQEAATAHLEALKYEEDALRLRLPINPNSPQQVKKWLEVDSSRDEVLAELIEQGDERALLIRQARKNLKAQGALKKIAAAPRYKGTLFPGAASGRFRSAHENLQNIARDQKVFIGYEPGDSMVVSADFAQLELRTIACISKDETMIDLFIQGNDLHDYSARSMFGPDFTKQQRQIAKTFNFSLLYGAGPARVGAMLLQTTGIKMPEDDIRELKYAWLRTYKGIDKWQKVGSGREDLQLPWHTPMGRPYQAISYSQMLSLENQGAGAEVARLALHRIMDQQPENETWVLVNFTHDAYLATAKTGDTSAALSIVDGMSWAWENAPFETHGVPMPISCYGAYNWKDADTGEHAIIEVTK